MSSTAEFSTLKGIIPQLNQTKSQRSLGIRGRLLIGFAAITVIFLIAIGITFITINHTKNFTTQVINVDLPTYDSFLDLNGEFYKSQSAIQNLLMTNDQKYKSEYNDAVAVIDRLSSNLNDLSKNWTDANIIRMWQEMKLLISEFKTINAKILMTTDKNISATMYASDVVQINNKIHNLLNTTNATNQRGLGIIDIQSQKIHDQTLDIINNFNSIQIIESVLSIIGILAAILIAMLTSRGILRHINIFRQHSGRIASGDLTQQIMIESDDELGQLGNDLNIMTMSLATISKEITQACHSMMSTLEEVRRAVDMQSSGASEQASSINEITSSLSEIDKSSAQTMEKAKALGEAAVRTREKGQLGLDAVDQSVNGMKSVRDKVQMIAQTILELSNQTQQVGEITSVVNSLAQQSKMLALNASIEAAKAGEAGKGFAVVAVEVKNLAEQSEQATIQVQKILEDIRHAAEKAVMVTEEGTKGVDYGTGLVEQTGEIIRNLNDVIHETTIATQQIESAVRQEGAGIEQITTGMNEINLVTASFVESVKQTTEAIGNLAEIAKNLKSYIDTYKV